MLKFLRNSRKPELIRIFFFDLASSLESTKEAAVAHSNGKTRTKHKPTFRSKTSRITGLELKREWEYVFLTLLN